MRSTNPNFDVTNQFTEGAYFGMNLVVDAIKKVGPNLTRAELKKVLDAMDYKTDFASNLSWRPGKHYANMRAQSLFEQDDTGWVLDPAFGG
jgi:ABC-type branched-subunit amino acid transport system substrate-binding protein